MPRRPTNMEKLVFGGDCEIDPNTDQPIERGHGCLPHKHVVVTPAEVILAPTAPAPEMTPDAQAH